MTNEEIQSTINSLQHSIDMLQSILDGTYDSVNRDETIRDIFGCMSTSTSRDEVLREIASDLYDEYRRFSIYNL